MVLVLELRILHPYTVEEFERGQAYGNMKVAEQMGDSAGSTMVSSTPYYDDVYGEGAFNKSITKLGEGRLPAWALKIIPASALILDEKCWSIYPYCKTSVTVPALQYLKIDTMSVSLQDKGTTENALGLPPELLAKRKVEFIDIGAAQVDPKDYREDRDPALVHSSVTGKGPLTPGWQDREQPIMCAYKAIVVEFRYTGLQGRVEGMLSSMMKNLFTLTHRTCFATIDQWYTLPTEDVLDMLDRKRQAGGTTIAEVRRSTLRPSVLLTEASPPSPSSSLESGLSLDSSSDTSASAAGDEDDDEFVDAEDLEFEDEDATAVGLSGRMVSEVPELAPSLCAYCMALQRTNPVPPAVSCGACKEFFCNACFAQVHITPKMQAHPTTALPDPKLAGARSLRCGSISMAGAVQHKLGRTKGYRREQSTAGGIPEETSAEAAAAAGEGGVGALSMREGSEVGASLSSRFLGGLSGLSGLGAKDKGGSARVEEGAGWGGHEEDTLLTWDKVKDPPLNVFVGPRGGTPLAVGQPGSGEIGVGSEMPEWQAILIGEEEESFVEVPEGIRTKPAELAAAMVSLMSGIYRSGAMDSSPGGPASQFSLAQFIPEWPAIAAFFPGFEDPSAAAPAPHGADQSGGSIAVKALPAASPSRSLEAQRGDAARLFRSLAEELIEFDPQDLKGSPAFWVNVHNALLMHAYIVYGIPKSPKDLSVLLQKASYLIGGVRFSASAISEVVLRPEGTSLGRITMSLPRVGHLKAASRLLASYAVPDPDPRIIFALSLGTVSSPKVAPVHDASLEAELGAAAKAFISEKVKVDGSKVRVPVLFYANRKEFGKKSEQLDFIRHCLPKAEGDAIMQCASQAVVRQLWEPAHDSFSFQYLF